MSDLFLGLDSSTQSLTAIIIDFQLKKVLYKTSVNFSKDFPEYKTKNGVIIAEDEKLVHSYPLMWVEALELLFNKLNLEKVPFPDIKAISGSGQQHGTVYLNNTFEPTLIQLDPSENIASQLKSAFTRESSPIWMDSSTSKQCEEIRESLGGLEAVVNLTGSTTFERFSGPQIRKFYQGEPENYKQTSTIHLVSSFMASILLGKNAPIDHGDGAGMNLMNISSKQWDDQALDATAPNLKEKLPPLVNSFDIIGSISPYFVERYGFSESTKLIAWSGDNPNSLIGVGLTKKGKVAISLGTSDTYFGYIKKLALDLNGEGHVFGSPTGDYMSLICYKNGSLAREKVKDNFNLDWDEYSEILRNTPPGNNGKIILPYFFPEIVPLVLDPKVYRFGLDENDVEGNVRAIIESQFLSMKLHSQWVGEKPKEIYATGGASANQEILQIAANIFNANIRQFKATNSAALGAALRSAKSYYDSINEPKKWSAIVKNFIKFKETIVIKPKLEYKTLYKDMSMLYKKCEDFVLRGGENPEVFRKEFIKKYFNS